MSQKLTVCPGFVTIQDTYNTLFGINTIILHTVKDLAQALPKYK